MRVVVSTPSAHQPAPLGRHCRRDPSPPLRDEPRAGGLPIKASGSEMGQASVQPPSLTQAVAHARAFNATPESETSGLGELAARSRPPQLPAAPGEGATPPTHPTLRLSMAKGGDR